jgi:hypothetical protein
MNPVVDGECSRLFRRLKERTCQHVEPNIAECRRNHLGAAIVAVLAQLGDHNLRRPA